MKNTHQLFAQFLQTPQKEVRQSSGWYNSSRSFQSTEKHRNPIFRDTSFNTTSKKLKKTIESTVKQSSRHFEFKQLISDDFCGCETTLSTCNRITKGYLNQISLLELKNCYQNHAKPSYSISSSVKKSLLNQLPAEYPEIYYTHLTNLLDHFQPAQITNQTFSLLAWIHIHCKFQHITFFFYCDLKDSLKDSYKFNHQIELALIKQNLTFNQELRYFQNMNLSIKSFLNDFHQSAGTNLIPFTQYAKFLEIVKNKGQKSFVQLISLLISKKRAQFYQILKYWTHNQIASLRNYSRYLNWDLFFDQIRSMQ